MGSTTTSYMSRGLQIIAGHTVILTIVGAIVTALSIVNCFHAAKTVLSMN